MAQRRGSAVATPRATPFKIFYENAAAGKTVEGKFKLCDEY